MTSKEVRETYTKEKYIEGVQDISSTRLIYKHKSSLDFVEFIKEVDDKRLRNATSRSSVDRGAWSGSCDFPEAIKFFREAKFDTTQAKKSSNLIIKMRQGVKYQDTGDELSVPEYLARSSDYFIDFQNRNRKKPLIFSKPIIINLTANASVNENDIKRITSTILNKLYTRQIRVPKIILSYLTDNVNGRNPLCVFIDVPYFDFTSLARFSYTSTFRRLAFTNYELVGDLGYGYGKAMSFPQPQTLDDVISVESFVYNNNDDINRIIDEAITRTFEVKKK